ncbi:uncharacterized protein LOC106719062 isoform X1 [Papilio machaon]|uniref:uncharacterized protein LOC106719062 isoform X1 n=1 Tax=Papilio machaon TaxID=76193 RepID=UPI001E664C52|nr:uncharacterized protein LOC106719062 isoform X1 [Papilio machaon]
MRSTYNESKHAIFVSDVDTCCSIDELRRNYSRSCNKKNSCHGPCKAKSKKKRKKGVDRAQIFPEKLSCGVESRHEETTTKRFPSDSRTREQVYQPRGCVPYKPPPGMTKETCERGSCFPSPCDSEKKCSTDTKPEKLPRRKDSDRRVTVNSKVKTIEPPSPCPPEPATKKCEETTQKTRVIEVKPKESIKSISQECGCTEAPPAAQRSVSREKHKKKVDKSSSAHRVKKPHTDDCKPKTKPIPTLKPAPSCDKPSKQNIKNSLLSDTKKISTDRKRRRDEVRAKINTSLSDTQTSRAGLRHSSNDSRMRPPSRQTSKTRNKSAPCNYRKPENENMKSNTKTVPSKETTPSKGLSDVKIPNKPKSDQCEPKVCTDARKISAPTRDVAVDIRCPICTCATQCHGTRCYRSTEIINPNLNGCHDIMSPSRYLLESQRHYNEMFSSKFLHTNICPAFVSQKQGGFCASKIKRNSLRGYKAKRPEHHSLRRQTSPRASEDRTRSDDSTRPAIRLLKGMRRYRLRNEAKLNAVREQKWKRHVYKSPTNKSLTKSQQNLCLQYGAAEDKSSSLVGHCNSASSF